MSPWVITETELFRRRCRDCSDLDRFDQALAAVRYALRLNPRVLGQAHPHWPLNDVWVCETPAVYGIPTAAFLYRIFDAERRVAMHSVKII